MCPVTHLQTMTPARRLPLVLGAAVGLLTWVLGYVLTYLLVAGEVEDSPIQRFTEAVDGEPATFEMVGWVFFNAHLVDTTFSGVPVIGGWSTNFISGEDGFSFVLYLIPVGLLVAAGIALGRSTGSEDVQSGVLAALTVVPGYVLASVVSVFLFEVTIAGASGGPALLPALFLAGVGYPVVCAGLGGALAAVSDEITYR